MTAPLYILSDDGIYRYAHRNYTGYIPTEQMCNEAKGTHFYIVDTVNTMIKKHQDYTVAKWVLGDKSSAIAFNDNKSIPDIIEWDGEVIKTFCFSLSSKGRWVNVVAYFNLSRIKEMDYRYLLVDLPEDLKEYGGVIAGKDHTFSSKWAEELCNLGLEINGIYIK